MVLTSTCARPSNPRVPNPARSASAAPSNALREASIITAGFWLRRLGGEFDEPEPSKEEVDKGGSGSPAVDDGENVGRGCATGPSARSDAK